MSWVPAPHVAGSRGILNSKPAAREHSPALAFKILLVTISGGHEARPSHQHCMPRPCPKRVHRPRQ